MDIRIPKSHPWYKHIVFDTKEQKHYNRLSDMFISDEDAKIMKLPPAEHYGRRQQRATESNSNETEEKTP